MYRCIVRNTHTITFFELVEIRRLSVVGGGKDDRFALNFIQALLVQFVDVLYIDVCTQNCVNLSVYVRQSV